MAGGMTLAELSVYLDMDTSGFEKDAKTAESSVKSLKDELSESVKSSAELGAAIGAVLADFATSALSGTIDVLGKVVEGSFTAGKEMQALNSRVANTFGENAARIDRWAKSAVTAFGMSEKSAKEYAETFANVFGRSGVESTEVYNYSTALTKRIADIAASRGETSEQVANAIESSFRGEYDALQRFIPTISADALNKFAEASGFGKWEKLNEATQAMLRYQYIMDKTSDMEGAYGKNSSNLTTQLETLQSNIDNLRATIGTSLLPVVSSLVEWFNTLFAREENVADGINAVKTAYTDSIVGIETTTTNALALVEALEQLSATTEDAASTDTWAAILSELQTTIPGIGDLVNEQTGKIEGGTDALREYITEWKTFALESAKQKAVQGMYDEYARLALEKTTLENEQVVADKLESANTKVLQQYEREASAIIEKGLLSKGYSQSQIDDLKKSYWNLNANAWFAMGANNNWSASKVLGQYSYGLNDPILKDVKLADAWLSGGGTVEQFESMMNAWASFNEQYKQYRDVDNASKIAELEKLIASQETEINTLTELYDQMFNLNKEKDGEDTPTQEDIAAAASAAATEAVSGMQVVLDTGELVGAVSAGISRDASNSKYTGN